MKQYSYSFAAPNGIRYTLVASRFSQAHRHYLRMFTSYHVAVYNGRYTGKPVKNVTVINIEVKQGG
jgi:hypothetical protein